MLSLPGSLNMLLLDDLNTAIIYLKVFKYQFETGMKLYFDTL